MLEQPLKSTIKKTPTLGGEMNTTQNLRDDDSVQSLNDAQKAARELNDQEPLESVIKPSAVNVLSEPSQNQDLTSDERKAREDQRRQAELARIQEQSQRVQAGSTNIRKLIKMKATLT